MKKVAVGFGIVGLVVVGIVTFLIININSVVKNSVEVVGSEVLGVEVGVEKVEISIFSGKGSISGLTVANPADYDSPHAITIDDLSVHVDAGSIGSDKIHIKEIIVDGASLTYEGNFLDSNIKQLQKAAETSTGGTAEEGTDDAGAPNLQIDRLLLTNTSVSVHMSFLDQTLGLTLPTLEINDLGEDEDASVADVINEVLIALNKSLVPLIRDNASGVTDKLKEVGEKVSDKLKGLFKRK